MKTVPSVKPTALVAAATLLALTVFTSPAAGAPKAKDKATAYKQAIAKLIADMVDIPGKDYMIGRFEVTQIQWEAIMGNNPSRFPGEDNPVDYVSWNDCQEFLKRLNELPEAKESGLLFRLPTEEEWEYACRAGGRGRFGILTAGFAKTLDDIAWYSANSNYGTHPVGKKKPNAFGVYDMHGNVWEWTATEVGIKRVRRGGSWFDSANDCEASIRLRLSPDGRNSRLGFRICASKEKK